MEEVQQTTAGTAQENQETVVARVSIKVPPFWKPDPRIWFIQLEAQFRNSKITQDQTKYDIVVSSIDSEILTQVTDILTNPPSSGKYDAIKKRLISTFADSETQRTQRLLTDLELGDRKPSQLLCEMRNLASDKVSENFLKTLWLQRLPREMHAILSVSSDDLTKLSTMADQIWELKPTSSYHVAPIAATQPMNNSIDELRKQVSELSVQVAELSKHVFADRRRQGRPKSRSRSRGRNAETGQSTKVGKCYYHTKFGEEAYRCLQPCSMSLRATPHNRPEN